MALKIDFPDRTDDICKDAYLVIVPSADNQNKNGKLEIVVYKSETHRKANKRPINQIMILLAEGKEESSESLDGDNCITQLEYNDIAWKTGNEVYGKMKTLKIKCDGEIIDLSKAIDVKEEGQ